MAKRTKSAPETASWTDPISTGATDALRSVEEGVGWVSRGIWEVFHDHPKVGAIVTGGLGLGCAMVIGVVEVAATVAAGYLGYRMFTYGESFTEALEKSIRLKEGELPDKEL